MTKRYEHAMQKWATQQDDWMHQYSVVEKREEDGWELVSVTVYQVPDRKYSNTVLWFKRPFVVQPPKSGHVLD